MRTVMAVCVPVVELVEMDRLRGDQGRSGWVTDCMRVRRGVGEGGVVVKRGRKSSIDKAINSSVVTPEMDAKFPDNPPDFGEAWNTFTVEINRVGGVTKAAEILKGADAAFLKAKDGLPTFRKVLGSVSDVEAAVEAVKAGKGGSGEEVEAGSVAGVEASSGDAEVDGSDDQGSGEVGGELLSGQSVVEADTADERSVVRKFPIPPCPKCRVVLTDCGEWFECQNSKCRFKKVSAEEVEEKWERERGE